MYRISEDEVLSQLQKLRQIRQAAGEAIAFLEHLTQLQGKPGGGDSEYNPDDYLEKMARSFSPDAIAKPTHKKEGGGNQ